MQLSSCLCIFVSESSVAWCTPPLSGNPPYFILRDHRVSLLGFLALADSSTIFYNLLSPDIYIFFVTKFTSSHKNSTQVRYINNVMVMMVKPTNTLKATTLKSTSIQLPKLTNKVHWNLFVQSPPFRELESRTSIRNIVVLFYRFVDLDNSRERTRDLWMKGGIFKTEIIKNKIIH